MSQTKKKKMKQPTPRLRTLVASLMLIVPVAYAANTEFSPRPLVGVAASFAPHIALALSVEYPTAGAAYSESTLFSVQDAPNSSPATKKYLGYFDNNKCYKYNHVKDAQGNYLEGHDGGYFYPSSMARSEGGLYGLCNAGSEKEEFSGNMLNYMTMTAIDIFRQAMTGGNRAKGVKRDDPRYTAGYEQGDTPTETFLRRASVQYGQNGLGAFLIADRRLDTFNAIANNKHATLRRLLPHFFIDVMSADSLRGQDSAHVHLNSTENAKIYGEPLRMGFYTVGYSAGATLYAPPATRRIYKKGADGQIVMENGKAVIESEEIVSPAQKVTQKAWDKAGQYDRFSDTHLHFFNDGFYLQIVRKVVKGVKYDIPENERDTINEYHSNAGSIKEGLLTIEDKKNNDTYNIDYYAIIDPNDPKLSKHKEDAKKWEKRLNVVIKVCDPKLGLNLEENCKQYGNNYKPEGLLQEYTINHKMRFATFGYLNVDGTGHSTDIDGGVLRSRMKWLINDAEESKNGETFTNASYGDEWSTTTGQFVINPDKKDADASQVVRSGTINYLNQFGDTSGYKSYDPAAELYNTALTYLRGTHSGEGKEAIYKQTGLNDKAKDGFPAIYNWDDPYKRGMPAEQQHCHANSIIFIGDTNTHGEAQVTENNPDVVTYTTRLFKNEDALKDFNVNTNVGSSSKHVTGPYSPAYMAGLAYWARTNNIRSDLTSKKAGANPINSSNFIIDVMEKNDAKASPMRNSYYLAAKYGGFSINRDVLKQDFIVNGEKVLPSKDERDLWTDDRVGDSSISRFTDGVPRNFAIANNPSAMKEALRKAMSSGAALNNPSQAATGLSIGLGEILDVSKDGLNRLLQSTYDYANLTGDVVVYKPVLGERKDEKDGTVERNLALTEVARTGKLLTQKYHGSNGKYAERKVFTIKDNTPYEFAPKNASVIFSNVGTSGAPSVTSLLQYILGDSSLEESGVLRKRSGLQGTVINSTATPITPVKQDIKGCTPFATAAKERPAYYAAAANDGMLHIFDSEGNEKMAYMAGSALDKLDDFAKIGFQHEYLNDGTPVVQDLCLNNMPETVLIGTTGRGGKSVYALDVTDISKPDTRNVKWEFTHADLGLTISKPLITKNHDGTKHYAIVSSGYNNTTDVGHIFVLDIAKTGGNWVEGKNFWKIKLGKSGVGAPFVYDGENDGIGDKIFVGDSEGKIWQLNSTKEPNQPFKVLYGTEINPVPLFEPNSAVAKPITGAPYAEMVEGKLMMIVGTGRYFSEKDLAVNQTNYAYGLIVDDQGAITDNDTNILEQRFSTDLIETKRKNAQVYSVSGNQMTNKHKGWRLRLMEGANIASNGLIRERQVANLIFARSTGEISAACVRGANVGVIEVDVTNGGHFTQALVDIDLNGKFDEKDRVDAAAIELLGISTSVGTFLNYRNPITNEISPAIYLSDGGDVDFKGGMQLVDHGTGDDPSSSSDDDSSLSVKGIVIDLRKLSRAEAGVRRISWREIF